MKKSLTAFLILAAFLAGIIYLSKQSAPATQNNETRGVQNTRTPISITAQEIRAENFTGSKPAIAGEGLLADKARAYVADTLAEFEAQANADVPAMREAWGDESTAASYSIEIQASQTESDKTESVVMSMYVYTGGAHGGSSYKVLTASKTSGEILSLADIIKADKREDFAALVREKLTAWRPAGAENAPVVFEEDVANLTFNSFANWSLDNENLILYFNQYEVGPGVLGAFPFPIELREIKDFLM